MNSRYYHRLNLQDGASIHEIKSAYRKLALKYHPDKSVLTQDVEKFKSITEAYQILKAGHHGHSSRIYGTHFAGNGFASTLHTRDFSAVKIFNNIWHKYAKYAKKTHHDVKYVHGSWRYSAMVWTSTASAFIHSAVSRCIQVPLAYPQIHAPALKRWSGLKTELKEKANFLQRALQSASRKALSQCQAIHGHLRLPTARTEMIKAGPEIVQTVSLRDKIMEIETEFVQKVPARKGSFEDNPTRNITRDKNPMTYNIWTSCKLGKFALISESDTAYFAAVSQFMDKCYRIRPYGAKNLAETEPTEVYHGRTSTGDVLVDPTIRWRSRHACLA